MGGNPHGGLVPAQTLVQQNQLKGKDQSYGGRLDLLPPILFSPIDFSKKQRCNTLPSKDFVAGQLFAHFAGFPLRHGLSAWLGHVWTLENKLEQGKSSTLDN